MQIGVITAPRKVSYLSQTLNSIARHWDIEPRIFEDRNQTGCVGNWYSAIEKLYSPGTYSLICEDDIEWRIHRSLSPITYQLRSAMIDGRVLIANDEMIKMDKVGFLSPYCSLANVYSAYLPQSRFARARMPQWGWCGALAILLTPHFHKYLLENKEQFFRFAGERCDDGKPRHLDYAIGASAQAANLEILAHMPTMITHLGEVSTNPLNDVNPNYTRRPAE